MIKCKSCGLEKDPSLFYESNRKSCKECVKANTRRNREEKRDYYMEYDRNRPNQAERNLKNIQRTREKYNSDPEYKEKILLTKEAWSERNSQKRKAQQAVSNAKRDGKLIKPDYCEGCGTSEKKIQAHHWSYEPEYWLDVVWLCTSCHGKEHRRLNELGRDPDKV